MATKIARFYQFRDIFERIRLCYTYDLEGMQYNIHSLLRLCHQFDYKNVSNDENRILNDFQKYISKLLFGEKKKSLTASEETLVATQKIVSGIDRLQSSMENLATTVSTHVGSVQVKKFIDTS